MSSSTCSPNFTGILLELSSPIISVRKVSADPIVSQQIYFCQNHIQRRMVRKCCIRILTNFDLNSRGRDGEFVSTFFTDSIVNLCICNIYHIVTKHSNPSQCLCNSTVWTNPSIDEPMVNQSPNQPIKQSIEQFARFILCRSFYFQ